MTLALLMLIELIYLFVQLPSLYNFEVEFVLPNKVHQETIELGNWSKIYLLVRKFVKHA